MNLRDIPKVELHRHLEGAVRVSTIQQVAPTLGIELPHDPQLLREKLLVTEPMNDLASVLNKFWLTQSILATPEILERVAFEAVEDAYNEGIRILELRYAPTFVQTHHENLSFEDIHLAFVRGVARAEKQFPVAVGLILIVQRVLPVAVAENVCDFAIEHKDTVIGLDLADNEVGFDCKSFAAVFQKARKAGLHITIHAGEPDVPEAPQSVIDAVEILQADRIGHGLQIIKNPKALKMVVDKQIPLELCPYSNWLTNAVKSHTAHPFIKLMDAGVVTTINSDDPGIMGSTILTDYELLTQHLKLTREQIDQCNRNAARASFISLERRKKAFPEAFD